MLKLGFAAIQVIRRVFGGDSSLRQNPPAALCVLVFLFSTFASHQLCHGCPGKHDELGLSLFEVGYFFSTLFNSHFYLKYYAL